MLFYSLRKILNKAGRSSKLVTQAFRAHASTRLPKHVYDPAYRFYQTDFSGDSYMLNPHELLSNTFRWKPREVAEYIGLASFRNYGYYTTTKDATLDLLHSPVSKDNINNNRLLRIVGDRVHFYYEEEPKRRKQIWH